jgi:hypothetical protein
MWHSQHRFPPPLTRLIHHFFTLLSPYYGHQIVTHYLFYLLTTLSALICTNRTLSFFFFLSESCQCRNVNSHTPAYCLPECLAKCLAYWMAYSQPLASMYMRRNVYNTFRSTYEESLYTCRTPASPLVGDRHEFRNQIQIPFVPHFIGLSD